MQRKSPPLKETSSSTSYDDIIPSLEFSAWVQSELVGRTIKGIQITDEYFLVRFEEGNYFKIFLNSPTMISWAPAWIN